MQHLQSMTTTQKPTKCVWCNKELPVERHSIGGREYVVTLPCTCDKSKEEQAKKIERQRSEALGKSLDTALVSAGVPARYMAAQIDDKDFEQMEISQSISWTKKGLYLFGSVGCGKTYRACAVLRAYGKKYAYEIVRNVFKVPTLEFTSSDKLFDSMRKEMGSFSAHDTIERLKTADIVCIDDIGKEKPSEWTVEKLFTIVNSRYEAMLPTIFTSQYSVGELGQRLYEAGNVETAKAILSRIAGESEIVNMGSVDRRRA